MDVFTGVVLTVVKMTLSTSMAVDNVARACVMDLLARLSRCSSGNSADKASAILSYRHREHRGLYIDRG